MWGGAVGLALFYWTIRSQRSTFDGEQAVSVGNKSRSFPPLGSAVAQSNRLSRGPDGPQHWVEIRRLPLCWYISPPPSLAERPPLILGGFYEQALTPKWHFRIVKTTRRGKIRCGTSLL